MMDPVLYLGSREPAVAKLVQALRSHGFWTDAEPDSFTPELERHVRYFQQTHLGPEGRFLESDGVVGPRTWWALEHASGRPQKSRLTADVPRRLGRRRTAILGVALAEHAKNVREVPDGSNRGPEIDKYLPEWFHGKGKGPAWCCYFYSWVVLNALGSYPLGTREGSCVRARLRAVERRLWTPRTVRSKRPLPGDAFVMDHGRDLGHIGFVLRVSEDGTDVNTVEGNCGNRVKVGLRHLSDPAIVGFIDNVPDERAPNFERGVVALPELGREGTR